MKRLRVLGILACVAIFGIAAVGSGSDNSSRDSVSISADDKEESSEKSADVSAAVSSCTNFATALRSSAVPLGILAVVRIN